MTVGFEAFNGDGFKIAGSDFANLCFYGKGTLQIATTGQTGLIDKPYVPGATVYFYRSPRPLGYLNGKLQVDVFDDYSGYYYPGYVVEYWGFGPPQPLSGVRDGIEIYNEAGGLTFNNARPFLKPLGLVQVARDVYRTLGRNNQRYYDDFTEQTSYANANLAFMPLDTRIYWTAGQFINPQSGATFTDVRRYLRLMTINTNGLASFSCVQTNYIRYGGLTGNFNYCPNANVPIGMLIATMEGL